MTPIEIALSEAEHGKEIYNRLLDGKPDDCMVLLFPDDDSETLNTVKQYIDRFLSEHDDHAVVFITSVDISEISRYTNHRFEMVHVSKEDMDHIIKYSPLAWTPLMRILSLKIPHHRLADTLKGFKDITMDMLVCRDLFEIWGKI